MGPQLGDFVSFSWKTHHFSNNKTWNVFGFKRYWCVGKNWALVLFLSALFVGFFSSKKTGQLKNKMPPLEPKKKKKTPTFRILISWFMK